MKPGQKGFTLVEMLVAVAIVGVIVVPLSYMIITLLTNPVRSNNENVVLVQVRNAGHWISRDVQTSRNVTASDQSGFPLTLQFPVDSDENNDLLIRYFFDGNKLKRSLYDSSGNLTSETLIADYIDTTNTSFSTVDATAGLHQLVVRAIKGEAQMTLKYEASQRLSSQ